MDTDADPQFPFVPVIVLRHRGQHFLRGRDRARRRIGIRNRRAEQREKAVAEKLVHDAAMAIENLDQHSKGVIQPRHDLLWRP